MVKLYSIFATAFAVLFCGIGTSDGFKCYECMYTLHENAGLVGLPNNLFCMDGMPPIGSAVNCRSYARNSNATEVIAGNSNVSDATEKQYTKWGCSKYTHDYLGVELTVRGCARYEDNFVESCEKGSAATFASRFDALELVMDRLYGGAPVTEGTLCGCTEDLCNSGNQMVASLLGVVSVMLLSFLR